MIETWYVLADGSPGDPAEIAPDKHGLLRHRDGRAVAYGPYGPLSRGDVDPDVERAKARAKAKPAAKELKPEEPAGVYKTRETKAN